MDQIKKICLEYGFGTVRWNAIFLNSFILEQVELYKYELDPGRKFTVLDIGCGTNSLLRYNNAVYKIGFDAWEPAISEAQRNNTHNEFILGTFDNLDKLIGARRFDFIIAIDFIEHLEKDRGIWFLNWISEHANIGSAIYTPNGFLPQQSLAPGDFQEHKSGWVESDFENFGYACNGAAGLKILRKEFHELRFRPKVIWGLISYLSQLILVKKTPKIAAAIWATKLFRRE